MTAGALLIWLISGGNWIWTLGCSRAEKDCPPSDVVRPVDSVLLAFLSRSRAAHHAADGSEAAGDRASAIRALEAITEGPRPGSDGVMPAEVREVLADTLARLSDLRSQAADFEGAQRDLERGLALVPTPTYFRGHLYEVGGLLEERRSKRLQADGDQRGAEAARARALEAFEAAMKIQAEVIEKGLPKK